MLDFEANPLLQDLHRHSQEFCARRLAAFHLEFERKDQSLQRLLSDQGGNKGIRTAVLERRSSDRLGQLQHRFLGLLEQSLKHFGSLLSEDKNQQAALDENRRAIESELALPNMVQAAELRHAAELIPLNERLSVVCQLRITTARNPFAPLAYVHAFEQTINNHGWDLQTRMMALRLFDQLVLRELSSLYSAMSQYMAQQGILPSRDAQPSLTDERKPDTVHEKAFQPLAHRETSFEAEQTASNDNLTDDQLLVIERTGRLFNEVLSEENLGNELKTRVSQLYTPIVQLALKRPELLDDEQHPVRKLLAALAQAGRLYKEATPLQQPALLRLNKQLIDDIAAGATKEESLTELAFRSNTDLRLHKRMIDAHREKQNRSQAGLRQLDSLLSNVRRNIDAKLKATDGEIPRGVSRFLNQIWAQYVTSLYLEGQKDNARAEEALAKVDAILSYACGRSGVPGAEINDIASHIRTAFQMCGCEELEIRQFLQELMQDHKHPRLRPRPARKQNGTGC